MFVTAGVAVLLLALTGGVLLTSATPLNEIGPTTETQANATISVAATGEASADPDLAVVRVTVVSSAETAEAAREQTATDAARMREALRNLGVPDDRVHTAYFHLGPEYDYTSGDRRLVGYRAVHAFEIESDVDQAGAVIDTAVGNGASQVDGVQFTLTEETRRALRAEALGTAMGNARVDAETIASAEGLVIRGVQSASTADVRFGGVPVSARLETGAGDATPTILEPGPVTVTTTVQVTYVIG